MSLKMHYKRYRGVNERPRVRRRIIGRGWTNDLTFFPFWIKNKTNGDMCHHHYIT